MQTQTLEMIMRHIHRWFVRDEYEGDYIITNGTLDLDFLLPNQYYRIKGSVFNDGLHKYGDSEDVLTNETFHGKIAALVPEKMFLALVEEIQTWITDNAGALNSPYSSENVIGVYSYTLKSGGSGSQNNNNDGPISWQSQFKKQLDAWRKLSE